MINNSLIIPCFEEEGNIEKLNESSIQSIKRILCIKYMIKNYKML